VLQPLEELAKLMEGKAENEIGGSIDEVQVTSPPALDLMGAQRYNSP
jgi:hypothetical protein